VAGKGGAEDFAEIFVFFDEQDAGIAACSWGRRAGKRGSAGPRENALDNGFRLRGAEGGRRGGLVD